MKVSEFCEDYAGTVADLEPMIAKAQRADAALREQYGYALEQLLIARRRALAVAPAREANVIHQLDARLNAFRTQLMAAVGVDLERFLAG